MTASPPTGPLRILVTALGGEGGGVLMNWIVEAARTAGCRVQATSVPGVAQRTGSTSYYIEIDQDVTDGRPSVLAMVPMPGRVDVVIASELVEAARALERGFVSPRLTTLITSSSRVYATAEKIEMGDGRFDRDRIEAAGKALSKQLHLLDLEDLARQHGTFISATMFGALAGSGVLPWSREVSLAVMGESKSAAASKAGFNAAFDIAATNGQRPEGAQETDAQSSDVSSPPVGSNYSGTSTELKDVIAHGHARAVDFQDAAYGKLFLDRTNRLIATTNGDDPAITHALIEAARRLALWMAYEDVARVADLKTRPERFARIAAEAEVQRGQVLRVTEYLKPGGEELAAVLPARFGRRLLRRIESGGYIPFVGRGIYLRSTGIVGFYALRLVAALKHVRRRSLRYAQEQAAIEVWLDALATTLLRAPAFAAALAELPRVLKGYAETQARGQQAYNKILETVVQPAIAAEHEGTSTALLREAIAAALADPEHAALDKLLSTSAPNELTADRRSRGPGTEPEIVNVH